MSLISTRSISLDSTFKSMLRSRKYYENISFGSASMEPQIRISAQAPAPAPDSFIRYSENYLFDISYRIKIVTIYKNFFSNHDFF